MNQEPPDRFWLDRPTFVTGASGLLGSWLVKRLLGLRADVVCLLREWIPQSELVRSHILEQAKVVRGDVRDAALLERIIGEHEIDTVFHLAAQTVVPIANRNPISTLESNIAGTWKLMEACRRSQTVKQVVVASSDKAYGHHDSLPYTEETPLNGIYPYDLSKACADMIGRSYAVTYYLPIVITRCGNFFGGGDLNWNRIIPGTIRSVLRGDRPVIRSDGQYTRDYLYIEDASVAYTMLAERLAEDRTLAGEAFNFSYEHPMSVLEIVGLILRLMDSDLEPLIHNQVAGEIRNQCLSAAKARRILGWKPIFTMEEGLSRTIEWYRTLLAEA
jgi:CDP-glucose 4,6-dehydratase